MFGMSSDHGRLPRMTEDLSRFLFGTTSRETTAGDRGGGGCSAAKLDVIHELLSDDDSGERTGSRGAPSAEETPWHPRSAVGSNNSVPGGSEAAMARSSKNSSLLMNSMTTVSSSESAGQQSPLWRRHGPPPPSRPHEPSQSATPASRKPRLERHES